MAQSWVPQFALSLNPPAWSLSNELFFYVLFPALWGMTRYLNAFSSLTAAVIMVLTVAILRGSMSAGETWNSFRLYSPLLNLPQFVLGMAIGYMFIDAPRIGPVHAKFFLAGIGSLCAVMLLKATLGWATDSAILCAVFGSIIFGAAGMTGFSRTLLSFPPMIILGESSYAIYILHFPIWLWWNHYTRIVYHLDWPSSVEFGVYLSMVIFVSIAVLVFIERPARRAVRR
jgi:peptidoglycan/LPS O-acetylase OafA/YrhL